VREFLSPRGELKPHKLSGRRGEPFQLSVGSLCRNHFFSFFVASHCCPLFSLPFDSWIKKKLHRYVELNQVVPENNWDLMPLLSQLIMSWGRQWDDGSVIIIIIRMLSHGIASQSETNSTYNSMETQWQTASENTYLSSWWLPAL